MHPAPSSSILSAKARLRPRLLSAVMLLVLLILFLVLFLLLCLPQFPTDRPPRRYRIQLDDPPGSRWDHIVDDHVQYVPLFHELALKFPEEVQNAALLVSKDMRSFFPLEYALEMEGIASRFGIPLSETVAYNIVYDVMAFERPHALFAGCTSIVACDEKGRIWHGRNLDYGLKKLFKKITIVLDVYRGEKLLYSGPTFVGEVGLKTGQRPGGFSVSMNARYSGTYAMNVAMRNATRFWNVVAMTLEEESTYAGAVARLATTPLICPAYIIVGGVAPFEGAVITRDRWAAADVRRLDEDNWYLAQTNYDHWKEDGDGRRTNATRLLSEMGRRGLNPQSLFGVLSTPPVRNNVTIFSGILSAATPSIINDTTAIIKP